MLRTRRSKENLLRQSLLNRLKARVLRNRSLKRRAKTERCALDNLSDTGEREHARSLNPTKTKLRNYLGPVEKHLVVNAEAAKCRQRKDFRRFSVQLSSSGLAIHDAKARFTSMSAPDGFCSPIHFVSTRCQFCEPIELCGTLLHNDSDNETYIDKNGIYTTDLCFSEV